MKCNPRYSGPDYGTTSQLFLFIEGACSEIRILRSRCRIPICDNDGGDVLPMVIPR